MIVSDDVEKIVNMKRGFISCPETSSKRRKKYEEIEEKSTENEEISKLISKCCVKPPALCTPKYIAKGSKNRKRDIRQVKLPYLVKPSNLLLRAFLPHTGKESLLAGACEKEPIQLLHFVHHSRNKVPNTIKEVKKEVLSEEARLDAAALLSSQFSLDSRK